MSKYHRYHDLKIEMIPLRDLKPNTRNARRHSRKQIKKIASNIHRLGFINPIIVDETGMILAGHGRYGAAIDLELAEVPCLRLLDLTPAEKTAVALADNKLGDESSFDETMLKELLTELTNLEFDVELTGFDAGEIDFRVGGPAGAVAGDPADLAPPPGTADTPVTRLGDIWQLGRHRLICGSALEEDAYVHLLGEQKAEMVFTDSPWNVPIQGHVSGLGKNKHAEFAQASGEMTEAQFRDDFLRPAHTLMARHSIDGSIHYACMDWRHIGALLAACEGVYSEVKNICVWIKASGGMGSLYRSQHEFVAVFKNGTAPHVNNVELGRHGRYRTNTWDYPGANTFSPTRDADLGAHPTVKPVALVADAIRDCSRRGGLILDPFLGSGTTILAAERTGRRAAGIEIAPGYVDVAVRRWQALTGKEAVLDGDGRSFDTVGLMRHQKDPAAQVEAGK